MCSAWLPAAQHFDLLKRPATAHAPVNAGTAMLRQRGAFSIMFIPVLLVILSVCGIAIDLSYMYNRKVELHGLARATALAAAGRLDGSATGVQQALDQAAATVARFQVNYSGRLAWSDAAVRFGRSPKPEDGWVDASSARGNPANLFYVEIDTSLLDGDADSGRTFMMGIFSESLSSFDMRERAVAGRAALNVTPLAICAMSSSAGRVRNNPGPPITEELVEFGFRRGVSYDLMQLNPGGASGETFVVDPVALPGGSYVASNTSVANVAPFVCAGKIWSPSVAGGDIHVTRPFPLASLYVHLNSRFDMYGGNACDPNGAPPDFNIKQFRHTALAWMSSSDEQAAVKLESDGKLRTVADPDTPPEGTLAGMYGPLWSYARAAKFSAYSEGVAEPKNGYGTFIPNDWRSLYKPHPTVSTYPNGSNATPYKATSGTNYASPSAQRIKFAQENRRVLNIPLLTCPVPAGTDAQARVAGIGRFFMTVPATQDKLFAEFAGIVSETTLGGPVELYP